MSKKMEGNRGNLYEVSEERRALRQAIKEALQSGDYLVHEIASSELSKLKGSQKSAVENIISEMGGMSAVKEKIAKEKNEFDPSEVVDTEKIETEMGPEYVIYDETQSSIDNLSDKVNKTLQIGRAHV